MDPPPRPDGTPAPTEIQPIFRPGTILDDRYRLETPLGTGGMGEVWRAFDLKLRVEVALKRLRPELLEDAQRAELLRREVRAARDVTSPHVCRIYDLVEAAGGELVSMEFVDGTTLQSVLDRRGPLDLAEAGDTARQLLAGLAAIHEAGLVHCDLKPSNVMITRSGRVVLMDFGIARGLADTLPAGFAGTPAYMAPEQLRGEDLDERADLYAAGIVLAEMLGVQAADPSSSRQELWKRLRTQPPQVPEGPWQPVIRRAVATTREDRYPTAAELIRALEEIAQVAEGREDVHPYPGLAAFTEADSPFFFGREREVETLWRKLQQIPMLALIGPSGVGKSSFLQAGLLPARPEDWRCVVCKPSTAPFLELAQSLVPDLSGDPESMRRLLRFDDLETATGTIGRWRQRFAQALIIVDQFEELFTLNPPEVQARFAQLLGRLVLEADVHLLVSMRDDFFFRCHEHEPLRPLFSEPTAVHPLAGSDLRRALVQPAQTCGYRIEDEALIAEMIEAVGTERGGLPLVAFTAARLWERRDRERGLLTREGYEALGGVGGALAQHAEATLERIGLERLDVVREIFRNLVTAQQTRVVYDRQNLLSVFPARQEAEQVLAQLIDARLLTSFETPAGPEGEPARQQVEIIHESLLTAWPRLVRWQTQDADGAQLRDQLRQAAQLWVEKHRSDDLLWTGTAYREFALWRERYPGGLSSTEESFAEAMVAREARRRRRRRFAIVGTFAAMLVVLGVVGTLWLRSERLAQRSEARRFHMLAEQALEEDNTLALALATASLEREDAPAVRRLALAALSRAPCRFVLPLPADLPATIMHTAGLSPDGQWLATCNSDGIMLWPADGGEPLTLRPRETEIPYKSICLEYSTEGDFLLGVSGPLDSSNSESPLLATLWSVPVGQIRQVWEFGVGRYPAIPYLRGTPPRLLVARRDDDSKPWLWRSLTLDHDEPSVLGRAGTSTDGLREFSLDPSGRFLLDWKGPGVFLFPLDSLETAPPTTVGHHEANILAVAMDQRGQFVASTDKTGEIRVWSVGGSDAPIFQHRHDETHIRFPVFDPAGTRLVIKPQASHQICVYDLKKPGAEPLRLLPLGYNVTWTCFPPDGSWLVAPWNDHAEVWFYPLVRSYPTIWRFYPDSLRAPGSWGGKGLSPKAALPDGNRLVADGKIGELWLCELFADVPDCRLLFRHPTERWLYTPASDRLGRYILTGDIVNGRAWLIPLDGSTPRPLGGFIQQVVAVALSTDARFAAVGGFLAQKASASSSAAADDTASASASASGIRIWDLATDEVRTLDPGHGRMIRGLWFLSGDRLLSASEGGLRLWDLDRGECEVLSERAHLSLGDLDATERFLAIDTPTGVTLWDLQEQTERILPIPSETLMALAISPDARFVVAGMEKGEVLYLPLATDEPHLLLGHEGYVTVIRITPGSDGFLTAGYDGTVRTWNLPQGRPLHTRPLDELLDILHAQTNLRAVADVESADGYRVDYAPFPGWQTAPTW